MQTILVVVDNFRVCWQFSSLQTIFENCERFSSLQTITLTISWVDLRVVFSKLLTIFELNCWRISSYYMRFSFRRDHDNDNKYLQNYFDESLLNSSSYRTRTTNICKITLTRICSIRRVIVYDFRFDKITTTINIYLRNYFDENSFHSRYDEFSRCFRYFFWNVSRQIACNDSIVTRTQNFQSIESMIIQSF